MAKILDYVGLSFDDVLLVPKRSSIKSRKEVITRSRFTKRIWLNIPIVSAAMDTVTESKMAITMAREGGIGVIHRFMSPLRQAEEVSHPHNWLFAAAAEWGLLGLLLSLIHI